MQQYNHKKTINPIFKYGGLRDRIHAIPRNEVAKKRKELCESIGICEKTLYNWMSYKFDSKSEIKLYYLEKIAVFFDTEIENLKSYPLTALSLMSK